MTTTAPPPRPKSKLLARVPAQTKPGKIKGLIYGPSGVGKTRLTSDFPNPYLFDTEGGAALAHYQERLKAAGGGYLGPEDGTLDPEFVLGQLRALASESHGYRTATIDSITKIYQTVIADEAERLGEKDAFGASKKPAVAFMRRLVRAIMRLDMNVWFVAHEAGEWIGSGNARKEIGKTADVWPSLIYELDLVLHAQKRGKERWAVVKKSRLLKFPEGDEFPLEYEEIAERFGRENIECAVTPLVEASAEQVSEIIELLNRVRVPDDWPQKVFAKYNVDSWNELTTEQATKVIAQLSKPPTPAA